FPSLRQACIARHEKLQQGLNLLHGLWYMTLAAYRCSCYTRSILCLCKKS
ncbi:hypothetical protein LINPERHAP2_LOCUS42268, partial [Linum perenne]